MSEQCTEHMHRAMPDAVLEQCTEHMHGRTYGRTNEEPLLPTSDNNSSVTRTRAYEISPYAEVRTL